MLQLINMILTIFTDGGSKGNPGPAAIGVAMYLNGKKLEFYREDLGVATNNVAEYTAVLRALEKALEHKSHGVKYQQIHFKSDSLLVVSQLNGIYKVKNAAIRDFIIKIRILESQLGVPIKYSHVYREDNTVADALVNNTAV